MREASSKAKAKPVGVNAGAPIIQEPERIELEKLNFAPFNPRRMPAEKMAALKASILKHGLVLNLVVQLKSKAHGPMVIIGGHQRVRAMREVCAERGVDVPKFAWAVVLDVSDSIAAQLNIALNRIDGEFDAYMLGELLSQFAAEPDFDALASELESSVNDLAGFSKSVTLTIEFDTVERRDQAKDLLRELAGDKKAGIALTTILLAARPKEKREPARASG